MVTKSQDGVPFERTLLGRIYDAAFNKVVEIVLVAVCGAVATYFGLAKWYPQFFESTSTSAEATAEPAKPKVKDDFTIGADNVGFARRSKYGGFRTEFLILDPGDQRAQAPFTEVKSGKQQLPFAVKTTITEGGVLGFGATKSEMRSEGVIEGNFSQTTLYAIVKAGQEEFLKKGLLPLIRKVIAQKLSADLLKADSEQSLEARLGEVVRDDLVKELETHLSLTDISFQIKKVTQLTEADLARPDLEKIDQGSMERFVQAPPKIMTSAAGPISIVAGLIGLIFLGLFIFQLFT